MAAAKRRGRELQDRKAAARQRRRLLLDVRAMVGRWRLQLVSDLLMAAVRRRRRLLPLTEATVKAARAAVTTCAAVKALVAATTRAGPMVEKAYEVPRQRETDWLLAVAASAL